MYLIFLTIPGNESLLKAEIFARYPLLKLSFSTKGMISFKCPDEKFIIPQNAFYSLMHGKFIEKNPLNDTVERFKNYFPEAGIKISIASGSSSEIELLINEKEIWKVTPAFSSVKNFNFSNELERSELFPARSYLKTKQVLEYLGIETDFTGNKVLDIGSAPGGNTSYLLSKGNTVVAIDPATMAPTIPTTHFIHLKKSVQEIEVREAGFDFDWIMNDMNLPLEYSLKQVLRFCKVQDAQLKGAIITMKTPRPVDVKTLIDSYENLKQLTQTDFEIFPLQVPAHRQESAIVLLAKKFFR
jgi:23S rRNA U2552 (ribose-2'-O)-methylase RlmE/FtsJ